MNQYFIGLCYTASLLCCISAQNADGQEKRLAIPSETARKSVVETIQSVFAKDYNAISKATPRSSQRSTLQLALAKKFIQQSATFSEPMERYAILGEAKRLAQDAGDIELVLKVIRQVSDEFVIDGLQAEYGFLLSMTKKARKSSEKTAVVSHSITLLNQLIATERFDMAAQLCAAAEGTARNSRLWNESKQLKQMQSTIARLGTQVSNVNDARRKLQQDPADPEGQSDCGKLCVFCSE